jgi:hypothetical protein
MVEKLERVYFFILFSSCQGSHWKTVKIRIRIRRVKKIKAMLRLQATGYHSYFIYLFSPIRKQ